MKITKEQLQFIDQYLKNSGFFFVDYRLELMDHIACIVEQDMQENNRSFYDSFKACMIKNKKNWEQDHEQLTRRLQKQSFLWLWPILRHPYMLLFDVLLLVFILNFTDWFSLSFPFQYFLWGQLLLVLLIYLISKTPYFGGRFSKIEAAMWPLSIMAWILHFMFNFYLYKPSWENNFFLPLAFFTVLFSSVCWASLFKLISLKREYNKKYQSA